MKHHAFTLAETLITLAIIGIVAAVTIPIFITRYQKHVFANKLAQTYAILNQAFDMAIAEHGDPKNWEWDEHYGSSTYNIKLVNKYLYPYLKGKKVQPSNYGRNDPYVICYTTLDGVFSNISFAEYRMANGTLLTSRGGGYDWSTDPWVWLQVDLNGKNGPNVLGKDIFNLFFYAQKRFYSAAWVSSHVPYTNFTRQEVIERCKSKNGWAGTFCFDLVMSDGWKIAPDYPW